MSTSSSIPASRWSRDRLLGLLKEWRAVSNSWAGRIGAFYVRGQGGLIHRTREALAAETFADGGADPDVPAFPRGSLVVRGVWLTGLEKRPGFAVLKLGGTHLYLDRDAVELAAVGLGIELARGTHPVTEAVEVKP